MIDHHILEDDLAQTLEVHRKCAGSTWRRVQDWIRTRSRMEGEERGGGVGSARSMSDIADKREDDQAGTYYAELDRLTERISSDLARLRRIHAIANPQSPKSAPDAGCISCARDGGRYEPPWEGRYRNACRFCGEWRATQGDWPALTVVRWRGRNPGKRVPVHVVEKAG